MEPKHLVIGGLVIVILVGVLWLAKLLPGFGFGLGGGKGEGGGPGDGSAADAQKGPQLPPKEEDEVLVSGDVARLKSTRAAVTPAQIAEWARAGRKFTIVAQDDAQRKIMDAFREIQKQSEGKIIIKE